MIATKCSAAYYFPAQLLVFLMDTDCDLFEEQSELLCTINITDCALCEARSELLCTINITGFQPAARGRICIKCELQ